MSETLLDRDDPRPFERLDFGVNRRVLVVCDHARNRLPSRVGTLGVDPRHLEDHIAWDIGAEGVATVLAERLNSSVILGGYSRLLVDLNRAPRDGSAIPQISDGVLVPGNLGLNSTAREARFAEIHAVYHDAIGCALDSVSSDASPVVIAIHSFTPQISGVRRPWHAGILWDKDPRLATRLLAALRSTGEILVGDNEPYSGRHMADYTIDRHAELRGFAHAAIEIRQDQIRSRRGQTAWAERIYHALTPLLEDPALYVRRS